MSPRILIKIVGLALAVLAVVFILVLGEHQETPAAADGGHGLCTPLNHAYASDETPSDDPGCAELKEHRLFDIALWLMVFSVGAVLTLAPVGPRRWPTGGPDRGAGASGA